MGAFLLSALIGTGNGCWLPSWEDRNNVRVVFSDDDSIVAASIHRFQYRELESGEETRDYSYELRLVPLDGSDETVLVPSTPGSVVIFHAMRTEGYALASSRARDGYQLWLDDGRLEPWMGGLIPSPSGRRIAVLRDDPATCVSPTSCPLTLHVYDAHTREETTTMEIPMSPPDVGHLRWLDDETLVAKGWLIRLGDPGLRLVETPLDCDRTPVTTSSDVSADGIRVDGHLEGDRVVLRFVPSDHPPWPGPCAELLTASEP